MEEFIEVLCHSDLKTIFHLCMKCGMQEIV